MVVAFPLDRDLWFGQLPISSFRFEPVEHVVADMTGAGEPIEDDIAPTLWEGEITLDRMTSTEADHARVMFDLLRVPGRFFWVYDKRRPGPRLDPTGAMLGAATPVIAQIGASGREISLSGLPAGYVLSRSDLIGWSYDSGRHALHRVVPATVTANGSGTTPLFEVSTLIRPGVTVGTAANLIRPAIPVRRVPGSLVTGTSRATITDGFTVQFKQTLGRIA